MARPLRLEGALRLAAVSLLLALLLPPAARGAAIVESAYSRVAHSGSARSSAAREGRGPVSAGLTDLHPPPQPPELTGDRGPYHAQAQDRSYPDRGANPTGRETWPGGADSGTEGLDEGVGAGGGYSSAALQDSQPYRHLSPETSKVQRVSYESESARDSYGSNGVYRQPSTNNLVDSAEVGTQVDASKDAGSYVAPASGTPQLHTFDNVERIGTGDDGGQIADVLTPPAESDPPPYWEAESYGKSGEEESETEGHYDSPGDQESVTSKTEHRLSYVKKEEVPTYADYDTSKVGSKSHDEPHYDDDDEGDDDDNDGDNDDADDNEDDNDSDNDGEQDDDVAHGDVTTLAVPADDVPPAAARQEADQRSESDHAGHNREMKQEPEHQKKQQESRLQRPSYAGYYGLGRKLWYVPLWFSVYYIIYLTALVIKSIARHKIQYPETEKHHGWDKRSLADAAGAALVSTVHRALREVASKYD